jgi:hypothetical protein
VSDEIAAELAVGGLAWPETDVALYSGPSFANRNQTHSPQFR